MVFIQELVSTWTKRSRGAPGAVARSAVPQGVAAGFEQTPHASLVREKVCFRERDGFRPDRREVEQLVWCGERVWMGPVGVELRGEVLTVHFDDRRWGWAPTRGAVSKRVLRLPVGSWGRLRFNGRRSGEDIWMYAKHVLNVAHGFPGDHCFVDVPEHQADLQVRLW